MKIEKYFFVCVASVVAAAGMKTVIGSLSTEVAVAIMVGLCILSVAGIGAYDYYTFKKGMIEAENVRRLRDGMVIRFEQLIKTQNAYVIGENRRCLEETVSNQTEYLRSYSKCVEDQLQHIYETLGNLQADINNTVRAWDPAVKSVSSLATDQNVKEIFIKLDKIKNDYCDVMYNRLHDINSKIGQLQVLNEIKDSVKNIGSLQADINSTALAWDPAVKSVSSLATDQNVKEILSKLDNIKNDYCDAMHSRLGEINNEIGQLQVLNDIKDGVENISFQDITDAITSESDDLKGEIVDSGSNICEKLEESSGKQDKVIDKYKELLADINDVIAKLTEDESKLIAGLKAVYKSVEIDRRSKKR